MVKIMSVASLFIMRDAEINRYAIVYLHLCFLSAIYAVIHIIFICTETPQYDWKGIQGPFECKFFFFFAKVVHVHINLANNANE